MSERTVLVVEPNATLSKSLCELLVSAGHAVVACSSFGEGKEYLNANTPDAIIARIRLHAFNGLHLVLLAKRRTPGIPAVVYSGSQDASLEREAEGWGVRYFDESMLVARLLPYLSTHLAMGPTVVASPA
jgi:DNA-binding NtrC family response regulator